MLQDFSKVFLITDLDGTLLTKDNKISKTDQGSIRDFVAQGGHFAVATGRMYDSAMQYIKQLHVTMPCILYNGGMILDTHRDEVLWECSLPLQAKEYTVKILEAFPEAAAEILSGNKIYIPRFNQLLKDKMLFENVHGVAAEIEEVPEPWMKVLFTAEHEVIQRIADFVRSQEYSDVVFMESSDVYYEMLAHGVSKGAALNKMINILKLDGFKIAAIGDYNNDIAMIKTADLGGCVANSPDAVKAEADVILARTSDENALTEFINYIKKYLEV